MSNRINSLSIQLQTDASAKDKLALEVGKVIENFQKNTISALIKNKDLSGDPNAGTVEAKRFANATIGEYGDARAAKAGKKVKAKPVPVQIDDDKEFLEEVEEKDLLMYGVDGLIERRLANIQGAMKRYFERKFFEVAHIAGERFAVTGADAEAKAESIIQKLEVVKNDFVDGVERDLITLVVSPAIYGGLRKYVDASPVGNVNTDIAEFGRLHGVLVFSSVYLPETVEYVILVDGAVAQPIRQSIQNPEKIQFSDATGFGLFLYAGTKAVTPDLIFFDGTLGSVSATSTAGTGATNSTITVANPKGKYVYKAHATAVAEPAYALNAEDNDWEELELTNGVKVLTLTGNTKIRVAQVDEAGRIIKSSSELTITFGA